MHFSIDEIHALSLGNGLRHLDVKRALRTFSEALDELRAHRALRRRRSSRRTFVAAESMISMRSPARRRSTCAILCASLPSISTMPPTSLRPSTKNRRAASLLGAERVLHAIEERALLDGIAAGARVLFEQITLAFVELRRHDDVNGHVMIAALRAAYARHAVAAQAQRRSGLRSGGSVSSTLPSERRHVDRRAERRLRKTHRHVDERVEPVAPEERMRRDLQIHVEIAGGPPRMPASPLPAMRMRDPSSTPAGTLTVRRAPSRAVRVRRTRRTDAGPRAPRRRNASRRVCVTICPSGVWRTVAHDAAAAAALARHDQRSRARAPLPLHVVALRELREDDLSGSFRRTLLRA